MMKTLTALSLVLITHTLHAHAALQGPRGAQMLGLACCCVVSKSSTGVMHISCWYGSPDHRQLAGQVATETADSILT